MDSNHDIVPTLRMMGGVMVELAADEIDRLRSQVARLGRMADTAMIPGSEPTHRCKVCGAYWRKWNVDGEASWNLNSHGCGECCDNAPMGDQIEALSSPARVGGDERKAFEECFLSDADIDKIAETMPCGIEGFLKGWGWRDFARAVEGELQFRFAALSADGGEAAKRIAFLTSETDRLREALAYWQNRASELADGGEDKRDAERCEWQLDDEDNGIWESGCGKSWGFIDGGPVENGMNFCHGCGKPLNAIATSQAKGEAQ